MRLSHFVALIELSRALTERRRLNLYYIARRGKALFSRAVRAQGNVHLQTGLVVLEFEFAFVKLGDGFDQWKT